MGVFDHSPETYGDFRAEGSRNSKGIRGYGRKGMRVWDFGWTRGTKGWLKGREEKGEMRLLMHATDPDVLEQRLGIPASKGCVRIAADVNRFLDVYGILDHHHVQRAASGKRPWILRGNRVETGMEGRYLVVLDSGAAERPQWARQGNAQSRAPAALAEARRP